LLQKMEDKNSIRFQSDVSIKNLVTKIEAVAVWI